MSEEIAQGEEYAQVEKIKELKQQAIELRNDIKRNQKVIDNPVLSTSIVSELDFFIDNVEDGELDKTLYDKISRI